MITAPPLDPALALTATAQVASTLAGFSGVVVVFGRGAIHEWPLLDRFRLRLMLLFSILPLVFSLVGILMLSTTLSPRDDWRLASAAAALLLMAGGAYALRGFLHFAPRQFRTEGGDMALFFIVTLSGAAIMGLQAWNAGGPGLFWPFLLAIVASMVAAVIEFVRLILTRPLSGPEEP